MKEVAKDPIDLWKRLCLSFMQHGEFITDDDSGVAQFVYNNQFIVREWSPDKIFDDQSYPELGTKLGYKITGGEGWGRYSCLKLSQLWTHYVDSERYRKFEEALREYRDMRRFTIGYNFKSKPVRSGGCLNSVSVIRLGNRHEQFIVINTKIQEVPKKLFADLLFFNQIINHIKIALGYKHSSEVAFKVIINNSALYFWVITMPLLLPIFGFKKFKNKKYRRILKRDWKRREKLAYDNKYKQQGRVWKKVLEELEEVE